MTGPDPRFIKKLLICLFFISLGNSALAQNRFSRSNFWSKVRYGGGLGLGFGNGGFNAVIAPSAIYQANDFLAIGTSLSFTYAEFNDDSLTAYGGSILSLVNPVPFLQLSAEFEELRVNRTLVSIPNDIRENYWSPALFLGLGYSNRNVTVGLRYDILYDDRTSINADALTPFFRVYF